MEIEKEIMWIAGKGKIVQVTIVKVDKDGQMTERPTTIAGEGIRLKIKEC